MSENNWGNEVGFFHQLGPSEILNAVDRLGFRTTGRLIHLNSMENRVYQVEVEFETETKFIVAKFYRPGRWSAEQILEEHEFLNDLHTNDISVVPPIVFKEKTLFFDDELKLYIALFERVGGRPPYDLNTDERKRLGRLIARIHSVGKMKKTKARLTLSKKVFAENASEIILASEYLPKMFHPHIEAILKFSNERILDPSAYSIQRIHGDFHVGNLLVKDDKMMVFDFDDFVMGPCIQDLWPLVAMCENENDALQEVLEGYEEIMDFDYRELELVKSLKGIRQINLCAWMCKRFEDPAFQNAFPFFGKDEYWKNFMANLYELFEDRIDY